ERSRHQAMAANTNAAEPKRSTPYAIGWKPCEITYLVTVKLSAQRVTVASSIRSASSGRRITSKLPIRLLLMPEPTTDQSDALGGAAKHRVAHPRRLRV